jgi:phospholipid transport system substrate-binding protein
MGVNMRVALLTCPETSNRVLAVKSTVSKLVYRGVELLFALSPYLCAAAVFLALQAPAAHAATPAESFIQQNIDKGYAMLSDTSLTPQKRAENFRGLLGGIMDGKRVAVFTLGPYTRGASSAQIDSFSDAFLDFVIAVLQHDISGNPRETLTVTGSVVRAPDDIIVLAKLLGSPRSNGAPINMGFRVRKDAKGADTLVDLQVEGVSMALAQRSDFSSWLQQHDGDVSGLTRELEKRAALFRETNAQAQTGSAASSR